jgi:hypothetical protein
MKKPLALLMALTFVISSFSVPAYAAVKAGAKCATKGEIKTSQGKKFTCVKSGKTLVWNKGIVVKTSGGVVTPPTPTPSATPTPTPTPTQETVVIDANWYAWSFRFNKDGTLERKQGGSNTWSAAPTRKGQNISTIRSKAFEEIKKYQSSSSPSANIVNLNFSPNVSETVVQAFKKYFAQSINFFSSKLPSGSSLEVLIATEKDDVYRKTTLLQILGNSNEAESFFQKDVEMFRQFDIPEPLNSSGGGTVSGTSNPKKYLYTGAVCSCFSGENLLMYNVAHEVTHFYQFAATPSVRKQNFTGSFPNLIEGTIYIPATLIEGSANTLGSALTVEHVGWYSDQMDWHLGRYKRQGLIKSIDNEAEAIRLMKKATTWLPESTGYGDLLYPLGQLQFEFYIATYGMGAYFELFDNIQKYGDFDSAMKKTVNISESEFYSAAASYVMQAYNSVKAE